MQSVRYFFAWLRTLPLTAKIAVLILSDYFVLNLAVFAAYALRLSALEFPAANVMPLYLAAPVLSVVCSFLMGIYMAVSRSFTASLERRIVASQALATVLWIAVVFAVGSSGFARSTVLIYLLLAITAIIQFRKLAVFLLASVDQGSRIRPLVPALIYGAGREGQLVLDAVRRNRGYKVFAFVDTDYTLVGRKISGLKVFSPEEMPDAIERFKAREVILAQSNLSRSRRRELVDNLISHGLVVKTVPNNGELVDGEVNISAVRPIHVEDLLGRDPVPPVNALMDLAIRDHVVMITGAGGSIGSELVRQAFAYGPAKIVLVENNEFALFEVHRQLEARASTNKSTACELVPVLVDIKNKDHISAIMKCHKVDIVFQAAAYKHVRMVQENAAAGISNNIFGTKSVAEAAMENKVKRFILISTDKAVRPTSIMGATKRVAEMFIQALAAEKGQRTIFTMVRFGNVLGSTGSVVPLFREQLEKGGPITLTHPDVTRYFMLIPEAAQLVIQAAAMAKGGEVFVLDMGEPVKIINLAKTMVDLAGLTLKSETNPDGDIEIKITGLKEGEKLYEELQIGSDISPTIHARIKKSDETFLQLMELNKYFSALQGSGRQSKQFACKEVLFRLANTE